MKIDELVKKIKSFPKNTTVLVEGYEGGYDSIKHIEVKKVKKYPKAFKGKWYYGDFADAEPEDRKTIDAVVLLGDRIKNK